MSIREGGTNPMKKFSKILALGMAAALVFGMSVSAAGSKDTMDAVVEGVNTVIENAGVQDSNGNTVDVKVEATKLPETVYNETFGTSYEDALAKVDANDTVNAAIDAVFATMGNGSEKTVYRDIIDVTVEGEIPAGGLYVPVMASASGEAYVVAHWNGAAWEVLKTKVENGAVYALFPQGFSPVYISILTVTGEDQPSNGSNNNSSNNNNNSSSNTSGTGSAAPSSPKTGETLPAAGILAVICLAAAAVCAKKVRYNR